MYHLYQDHYLSSFCIQVIIRYQNGDKSKVRGSLARFSAAFELLESYSLAKVVITQRIHTALPCVAMGVPVIFINAKDMPGGGGNNKGQSSRVAGLTDLFHTIDRLVILKTNNWFEMNCKALKLLEIL